MEIKEILEPVSGAYCQAKTSFQKENSGKFITCSVTFNEMHVIRSTRTNKNNKFFLLRFITKKLKELTNILYHYLF